MKYGLIRGFCRRFCLPGGLVETNAGFYCVMPVGFCKFVETNMIHQTGHLLVSLHDGQTKSIYDLSSAKSILVRGDLSLYVGSRCVSFRSRYHADNFRHVDRVLRRPYLEVDLDERYRQNVWPLDGPVGVAYRDVLAGRACKEQFLDWLLEKEEVLL